MIDGPSPAVSLRYEPGEDGVAVLTLDVPGATVNTLTRALAAELSETLTRIEQDAEVKAVVLVSGKPGRFVAGADIHQFVAIRSTLEAETLSREGAALFDRIESCRAPFVAAVDGACVGGGLELILACAYRIATDAPATVLGLPESRLGLVPGLGGTVRLPRLVGLRTALELVLSGRSISSAEARRLGLVDAVVPPAHLMAAGRRVAQKLVAGELLRRKPKVKLWERLSRSFLASRSLAEVTRKTRGLLPAAPEAVRLLAGGLGKSPAAAQVREAEAFGRVAVTPESRALVKLFLATQEARKDDGCPADIPRRTVQKVAVLGAGLMGAGIAEAAAAVGVLVRLRDTSDEALGSALGDIARRLERQTKSGKITRREATARLGCIAASTELRGLRRADLVVESVPEDLDLKRKVLAEAESQVSRECVLATNTSALPISGIALGASRPERVLGLHFFSPVHRMPLVEVVVTPETAPDALATATAFARRLGKHVIVVRDGAGFFTTRTLAAALNEGIRLLDEGARTEDVDGAMESMGFAMGPLAVLDEVGLTVAAKVAATLESSFGERFAVPGALGHLEADRRLGRRAGRGFFVWDKSERKPDDSVYALMPGGAHRRAVDLHEIRDRILFALLNEAVLCFEEGILRSARDGDIGAVFGFGFPAHLGGPFHYLDSLGARFAVEVLERLAARHGSRFTAAPMLQDMARTKWAFYA